MILAGEAVIEVLEIVAQEYGVPVAALRGPRRTRSIAEARLVAYALLREVGMSLPEIGEALRRDHTTVLHGIRRAALRVAREPYAGAAYARMRKCVFDARDLRRRMPA